MPGDLGNVTVSHSAGKFLSIRTRREIIRREPRSAKTTRSCVSRTGSRATCRSRLRARMSIGKMCEQVPPEQSYSRSGPGRPPASAGLQARLARWLAHFRVTAACEPTCPCFEHILANNASHRRKSSVLRAAAETTSIWSTQSTCFEGGEALLCSERPDMPRLVSGEMVQSGRSAKQEPAEVTIHDASHVQHCRNPRTLDRGGCRTRTSINWRIAPHRCEATDGLSPRHAVVSPMVGLRRHRLCTPASTVTNLRWRCRTRLRSKFSA
ncbi:hypothetical protein HDG42_006686 [Paraburkholderia sp. JPY171]|nr:hypothetical protein [Paraburkholderia atlantica]